MYVVTSGEHSDYGINAVFSTNELAQMFIDSFSEKTYYPMSIEEWDLDPNADLLKYNRKPYFLRVNKEGNVRDLELSTSSYMFGANIPTCQISYTQDLEWMNVRCFADNDLHAVKIAGEKRAQILAANLWGVKE